MNSNIEDNTLIGENRAIREEIEGRIKYTEEYTERPKSSGEVL
jgi:hypothetical protein